MESNNRRLRIVLIAPSHDAQTRLSYTTVQTLLRILEGLGNTDIIRIPSLLSFEYYVNSVLKNNNPDFLIYFGHGEDDKFRQFFGITVLDESAAKYLKGTLIYSMACDSLNVLGQKLTQAGAASYIGNTATVYGAENIRNERNYADEFTAIWKNEVLNLLHGVSVQQSVEFARRQWGTAARLYSDLSPKFKHASMYAELAEKNRDAHGYVGNGYFTLPDILY